MKRKDAPQLFEIMRTTLAGRIAKKEGAEGTPTAAPAPAPAPLPAPPTEPPADAAPPTAPEIAPAPESVAPPLIEPPPPPAPAAPTPEPPAAAAPEEPASIAPPPAPLPPLPPEPEISIPPPRPQPRPRGQPFVLKPPSPGLFDAGPEHRLVLSYPASLIAAALLFVILFVAFAFGRTAPTDPPPPPPRRAPPTSSVPSDQVAKLQIPLELAAPKKPSLPAPLKPAPAPRPKPPESAPASRWTILLLQDQYAVAQPDQRREAIRNSLEPAQKIIRQKYNKETRIVEWKKSSKINYIGLCYGRWNSAQDPEMLRVIENLRDLQPFEYDRKRKPFEKCQTMLEPRPE